MYTKTHKHTHTHTRDSNKSEGHSPPISRPNRSRYQLTQCNPQSTKCNTIPVDRGYARLTLNTMP